MTLPELVHLIQCIPSNEEEMIALYTQKKEQLIDEINQDLATKGLGPFTEAEMLSIWQTHIADSIH